LNNSSERSFHRGEGFQSTETKHSCN